MLLRTVCFALCVAGCFCVLSPSDGWAQASAQFEVASIKALEQTPEPGRVDLSFVGTSGRPFKILGERVSVRGDLTTLIADAFGIKNYQIQGAPAWATNVVYTVTAKAPGDEAPTQDQARMMLQALLTERFKLKFHRDIKEMAVYHMIQAKKSNLFKAAAADETFSWNLTQGPGGTLRSKATKESIGDFVQLVGVSTDKPVMDKTGITGDIDYDILISPPEGRSPEDTNRAIVYAVVDQLGLKLESAKDAVEMLVIDHAEKASED